jgi:hypothetical protein
MNNEMFVEDIGGLWECGSVVKLDLVTVRPDAPSPGKVLVCRLVIPRDDVTRIAKMLLEALHKNKDGGDSVSTQPMNTSVRDEIVLARTE